VTTVTALRESHRYCLAVGVTLPTGFPHRLQREARGRRLIDPGALAHGGSKPREGVMLWTIFVILLVLWLLGVVSSYTLGGFIHVLLVVAVVIALIQLIQGRRVV
jgi:hypothetical protein